MWRGGAVNITAETEISTGQSGSTGYGAYGILAQSIGGGGGLATVDTAAANGIVTLGGTTSASGVGDHGGQVYMDYTGGVTTQGGAAHAVVLQSIGGGGGVAIIGSSREWSGTAPPSGQQVDMTLGSHNSFGAGQTVTAVTTLSIATSGENAFGFVAQSIGGGGGIATSQQGGEVSLGMQAAGSDSYNGSTVTLNQSLLLTTSGVGSHGVVAQSIGGGGGIANPSSTGGLTTTPATTNSGTALGYGGAVNLTVTGTIQTSGVGAYGVIAQTISGGGGLTGNFAGSTGGVHSTGSVGSGTAGNVSVTTNAHIVTSGSGSTAIFAQNATAGSHGAGNVTLSLDATITGGSGPDAQAVWVDGGNSANSITIQSGGVVSAASRRAIQYTGQERVDVTNYGVVYGSVSLSDTSLTQGIFTNEGVATFFAEGDINATVNDYGSLFIGTSNEVGATATFSGKYTQFSTGTVVMDIINTTDYDQMLFADSGYGDFGDEIQIRLSMDYNPVVGDTFQLIGAGSGGTNLLSSSWETTSNNGFVEVGLWNGTSLIPLWDGVEWETIVEADRSYTFVITNVPEPGAALLVVLGAGGLLGSRRGRRRH